MIPASLIKRSFVKQAYKDAVHLADQSQDRPLYGTDASEMYFGRHTQDSTMQPISLVSLPSMDIMEIGYDELNPSSAVSTLFYSLL
jgi:hypothetical protein